MRVRVAAIIKQDDRLLLVSTKRGPAGYFVPPGGGIEADESLEAALRREIREEAGLEVEPGPLLAWREFHSERGPVLELYFGAWPAQKEASATAGEGRQAHWISLAELPAVPHLPEELLQLVHHWEAGAGALSLGPKTEHGPAPSLPPSKGESCNKT